MGTKKNKTKLNKRDTLGNSEHFPTLSKTDMTMDQPKVLLYESQNIKDIAQ